MTDSLPPFPVDDSTLMALEHAMRGVLTFERPDDCLDFNDDGPWLIDSEFSVMTLLVFLSGCVGKDYSEHDVIQALINEVRRLRGG